MRCVLLFAMLAVPLAAADTHALLSKGAGLSDSEAAAMEKKLAAKPDDRDARVELLGYWTGTPHADTAAAVAARARHILWLIRESPHDDVFGTTCGPVYLGGPLADPQTFEAGKALWLAAVRDHPDDTKLAGAAASWMALGSPEDAERLFRDTNDSKGLGWLYAEWVLGVVAEDCKTQDPIVADAARRGSAFGQKARRELMAAGDGELLGTAARSIFYKGGVLYSNGKLDWDYTEFLKPLMARARDETPTDLALWRFDPVLPERGERPAPAGAIRIGGNGMASRSVFKTAPVYPPEARERGTEGTVKLVVLIGRDGKVAKAAVLSGPMALASSALDAVQQWRYEPIVIRGEPIYVETQVEIKYVLDGSEPKATEVVEPRQPFPGTVTPLRVRRQIPPAYPPLAREKHIEGVVQLRVVVGEDGRVTKVEVLSGPEELRSAALKAVEKWEFEPVLVQGKPSSAMGQVVVNFTLRGSK